MFGLMQEHKLLVSSLIEHAVACHPDAEIVSRTVEGPIHRCTYRDIHRRAKQVANALSALDVQRGDRVATLAWNGYRHMELYFGVSGTGAVLHTVNPRLFPEQLEYIINHAEDTVLFFDLSFVALVEKLLPRLNTVRAFVLMTDRAHMPECAIPGLLCYEDLLAAQSDGYAWPDFDESTAASLCYTSGTTGMPKGVLYSHRSTVLHAFGACTVDSLALSRNETALLVVPMFHVNAWSMPYAGAMSGAKLVLPGPALDGASVYQLLRDEQVTLALGVPTVWMMLLQHASAAGLKPIDRAGAASRRDRRRRRAAGDGRGVRARFRRLRGARLGHDRDLAGGHGLQPAAQAPPAAAGAAPGRAGETGPRRVRRQSQADRRRRPAPSA